MAKVDNVTAEAIEILRGKIDFYMLRGILPVARSWPKKPKPPYTALQAEAMAVFAIANDSMRRLSTNMIEEWRKTTVGVTPAWTDVYRSLIMKNWKLNRNILPIAIDVVITDNPLEYTILWTTLQLFIDKTIPEIITIEPLLTIVKADLVNKTRPIYITLYDDTGQRVVAPNILLEGE